MRRSRFSEEEILALLHEQEAGTRTAEICEKHGISLPTFYGWKAKFGVAKAKRLKQLEGENGQLRRLLARALLDNAVLKSSKQE
jgi:putative transposase